MRHFGGGVGHINNTIIPSVDMPSDMDVDGDEEAVGGSINTPDSDVQQVDSDVVMGAELDPNELDDEMDEDENDKDLEDLDLDEDLANDEEVGGSDDDGYASL
jgi:hypothetical protein